ncbi:unnamed protein product [Rhodiola kirilowii]
MLALVKHRTKEVEHFRKLISHYQTQLIFTLRRIQATAIEAGM